MRRFAYLVPALFLLLAPAHPRAQAAAPAPPHAWLFGAWTGGIFPAPSGLTAQECLAQPTVIFTRDVVMRATLTDTTYTQRVVESARLTTTGTEFRFATAAQPATGSGLLGLTPPPVAGFGCENPDILPFPAAASFRIPWSAVPGGR
jgi:hypothetical protein